MKRILVLLLGIMLLAGIASAEEKDAAFLGKPFPDFTVTDTEGNTFILSEALKDYEAVLINFWATWCGPCRNEFPYLNEAYGKYRDRVAFIALSTEKSDTMEKIEAYRKEHGIPFPMGRYTDEKIEEYIDTSGIPVTVIVDRFGNAVFVHNGALSSAGSVERVLDTFLGDGYTESAVLKEIPKDTSTHGYPVSAARAIYPEESGKYRKVLLRSDQHPNPITGYIIPPDETVRLRIEIGPEDDAASMVCVNMLYGEVTPVASLLDPDRGVYVYDVEMPGAEDDVHYLAIALYDGIAAEDNKQMAIYLYINEETVLRSGAAFELVHDQHSLVLGGFARTKYTDYEIRMKPGDILFVYTDGVPEANDINHQRYGTQRLLEALNASASSEPEELLAAMKESVSAFTGNAEQFDDLTMLCVRFKKRPGCM